MTRAILDNFGLAAHGARTRVTERAHLAPPGGRSAHGSRPAAAAAP